MGNARLSEADAVRLANRFGRSPQDFVGVVGLPIDEAASKIALDPEALRVALAENAERAPSSGAERPAKKATKKRLGRKKDA